MNGLLSSLVLVIGIAMVATPTTLIAGPFWDAVQEAESEQGGLGKLHVALKSFRNNLNINEDLRDQLQAALVSLRQMDGAGYHRALSPEEKEFGNLSGCGRVGGEAYLVEATCDRSKIKPVFGNLDYNFTSFKKDDSFDANFDFRLLTTGLSLMTMMSAAVNGAEKIAQEEPSPEPISATFDSSWFGESYQQQLDKKIYLQANQEFPHLTEELYHYIVPHRIMGTGKEVQFAFSIDIAKFTGKYKHLAGVLEKLEGALSADWVMKDTNGRKVFAMRLTTSPLRIEIDWNKGALPEGQYNLTSNIRLSIDGITLDMKEMTNPIRYVATGTGRQLQADIVNEPRQLTFTGRAYGVFPIWLIDVFIPGNIEEHTKQFIAAICKGQKGKGSRVKMTDQSGVFAANGEFGLLSNGFIAFVMRMQRWLGLSDDDVVADSQKLLKNITMALQSDYLRQFEGVSVSH